MRLAECATAAGDPDEAIALADEADQRLRSSPDPFVAIGVLRARAEALLAAGRLTDAHAAADEAVAMASAAGAAFEQARVR